jgi:hypothetical protein
MPDVEFINLRQLQDLIDKTRRKPETFIFEFAQDLGEAFVEATPVLTGNLRNHWYTALNSPQNGSLVATTDVARSKMQVVADMNIGIAPYKPGDDIWFVNGAAYAAHVEYGTELMAPRSYVRGVLGRARRIAKATATRIRKR